jgi:hypothetical protein
MWNYAEKRVNKKLNKAHRIDPVSHGGERFPGDRVEVCPLMFKELIFPPDVSA